MIGLGALAAVSAGLLAQSRPPSVTARSLQVPPPGEWLTYGRDQAETHFSPLTQISTSTVTGDVAEGDVAVEASSQPTRASAARTPAMSRGPKHERRVMGG